MIRKSLGAVLVAGAALVSSCSHTQRVQIPPTYNLLQYPVVGIVEFSSPKPKGTTATQATRQFMQNLTQAQPGVRILELGNQAQVLQSVGKNQMDAEAIRAIAGKNGLQALFIGNLEISDPKPRVDVRNLTSVGLTVDVHSTMAATLYDAATGALLWTSSTQGQDSIAGASISGGSVGFGGKDEGVVYSRMIQNSAFRLSDPFRSHWVTQEVPSK